MTISTEVRKAGPFIGNGSASAFPFAFKVFKAADLIVVRRQDNIGEETTLVLDSDYHVTLNSNQDTTPGGVVTLVAGALASGFTLVVSSELPYLQPTDLTNQGGFYPKVITNALDRLTIFCQQLAEITGRTLKLPITAPTDISAEIPLPNPSELIAWDETGTRLTTVSPQSLVTSIAYGSATADLFAGDGATTTFPLSTNPASVNNLDVSVGGFSQRPVQDGVGDYSWNGGASITFVVPPPAPSSPGDKNVLVRYMQAIPVSDSEALHAQTREALRRGYAEAGCTLVAGSFETGGTLTAATDVLLQESTGAVYAWTGALPKIVAPGFDPAGVVGFELRTLETLRAKLATSAGAALSLSQVATAYGIPFDKLAVWSAGAASDLTKYWWHDNKIWRSNAYPHTLEEAPDFTTAHIVPTDGVLYPDHFGASYIAGADQTPALQRMETWQALRNAPLRLRAVEHTLLTKLVITRAPCIVCEAGGFGFITPSPSSSARRPQGAVLVGKVAGDFSLEIAPTLFEFGGQICNVTVTGKSSVGDTKTAGKGVRLHNFGWSGRVSGFSVLGFNGVGLEIGYLQDTVFDQLSVIGCGPTSAQRALMFTSHSNYLYFNNAHIEDGNYLLGCAGVVDKPWEIHWNGCHFESGDYNGAQGAEFDHSYTAPPVEFDGCYRWYWNDATMVPASVQRLQSINGGDTASQPYFMSGANTSRITGSLRFICPRSGGGIDAMQLTGDGSANRFSRIDVEGAQGAKYCISMESGIIDGGSMGFNVPSEVKLFGINVNRGRIDSIRFANNAGGSAKTSGYLINSSVPAGLVSGEHFYEMGTAPYRWINQYVHSVDSRINDYTNIVSGATIDMEAVRPDNAFYNGTSGATVANIVNCQRSRRIKFRNDTGGNLTITGTTNVKNDGAGNFAIPAYSSYMMKADHTGVLYKD